MYHIYYMVGRRQLAIALLMTATVYFLSQSDRAQFFRGSAVGGVKIDANGVVSNPQVGELKQLQSTWQQGLKQVPTDLEKFTELRFVSLKQLESQIAAAGGNEEKLPDAVCFLA